MNLSFRRLTTAVKVHLFVTWRVQLITLTIFAGLTAAASSYSGVYGMLAALLFSQGVLNLIHIRFIHFFLCNPELKTEEDLDKVKDIILFAVKHIKGGKKKETISEMIDVEFGE